ncbi:MAG: benzoate-CoA ligase family protein [Actinomycetota bacterium]|nr:benzoate-CoA ligase family protein [Actinomycetota bacterium]
MPEVFNASSYLVDRQLAAGLGERTAVVGATESLTYAELAHEVARTAGALAALGVRPEERVMLLMLDSPAMLAAILGAMRIGAVAVPVSTMLTGAELGGLLTDSRARVLLLSAELKAAAAEAVSQSPEITHVVVDFAGGSDGAGFDSPRAEVQVLSWADFRAAAQTVPEYPTWADSPALWLYTSGTTGKPKAAMHRHLNIKLVEQLYGQGVLGVTAEDRCLSVAKLFFAYGIGNSAFFPLGIGATTLLEPGRPTPASIAARVVADRPTLFFGVPTFYAAVLASDVADDTFASVRQGVSAGEALPAELFRRFRDRFGVEILDGIGSTEALHIFLSNRAGAVVPGTSGTPVPGYDIALRDEATGVPVPDGEPGSLYLRGPSLATGYWCRTDTTRAVFQGDWLRTGDTYVKEPDTGAYRCLGRSDDMIKAGGIWVSPTEVESRLLEHPSVAEVAVVGVADTDGLEKPVAYVVAAPGQVIDPAELDAFCRSGLAAFKRPRKVVVVSEIPKTATGKLKRYLLRDEAEQVAQSSLPTLEGAAS